MKTILNFIIPISFLLFSCKDNQIKRVLLGNLIVEGNIAKDTTYEGLIKFYDASSKKLVTEAFYKDNVLEGKRTDYYLNGKKKSELNYANGETLGYLSFYDSIGSLMERQYSYYGLKVGPSIKYQKNVPYEFYFYSFDNDQLFHLRYDSIGNKGIPEIHKEFFFFERRDLTLISNNKHTSEYFLYMVNPPKYKFTYSLCIIDGKYTVQKVIKEFDSSKVWDTFYADSSQKQEGHFIALRIQIEDSINDLNATMFKKII